MTDRHVQVATESRLLKRSCESLLGICGGLVADGGLNDLEIKFLRTWLAEHAELAATWPGELVLLRIEHVLADGVVTEAERAHLLETLQQLVGGSFVDSGAVPSASTTLPIDEQVVVRVPGQSFCFTGQFLFGTRTLCEKSVLDRGGLVSGIRKDLDFLVVGEMSSRDWKYSSFGNKIEAALGLRAKGSPLAIVSEAQWVRSL
jgi:NAD-dependent DNA ligase